MTVKHFICIYSKAEVFYTKRLILLFVAYRPSDPPILLLLLLFTTDEYHSRSNKHEEGVVSLFIECPATVRLSRQEDSPLNNPHFHSKIAFLISRIIKNKISSHKLILFAFLGLGYHAHNMVQGRFRAILSPIVYTNHCQLNGPPSCHQRETSLHRQYRQH
jgi:hypothetical protein